MKYIKTNIFTLLVFIPLISFGQLEEPDCTEEIPIEMHNLQTAIIKKQNLNVWPSIVEIKNLSELYSGKKELFMSWPNVSSRLRIKTHTLELFGGIFNP